MNEDDEQRIAAHLAKTIAMMCVRNTILEDIHAGLTPVTRTGDYSDVMVIDADGRNIPWPEVSQFDDDTMRDLMRQVVNRVYPGGKQISSLTSIKPLSCISRCFKIGNFLNFIVTAKCYQVVVSRIMATRRSEWRSLNCLIWKIYDLRQLIGQPEHD